MKTKFLFALTLILISCASHTENNECSLPHVPSWIETIPYESGIAFYGGQIKKSEVNYAAKVEIQELAKDALLNRLIESAILTISTYLREMECSDDQFSVIKYEIRTIFPAKIRRFMEVVRFGLTNEGQFLSALVKIDFSIFFHSLKEYLIIKEDFFGFFLPDDWAVFCLRFEKLGFFRHNHLPKFNPCYDLMR